MQKLEDELDNRLADEALAEDSEDVQIEMLFQHYGRMLRYFQDLVERNVRRGKSDDHTS